MGNSCNGICTNSASHAIGGNAYIVVCHVWAWLVYERAGLSLGGYWETIVTTGIPVNPKYVPPMPKPGSRPKSGRGPRGLDVICSGGN